jgi:hypothetical protein
MHNLLRNKYLIGFSLVAASWVLRGIYEYWDSITKGFGYHRVFYKAAAPDERVFTKPVTRERIPNRFN